jgi:hypothetical protein
MDQFNFFGWKPNALLEKLNKDLTTTNTTIHMHVDFAFKMQKSLLQQRYDPIPKRDKVHMYNLTIITPQQIPHRH